MSSARPDRAARVVRRVDDDRAGARRRARRRCARSRARRCRGVSGTCTARPPASSMFGLVAVVARVEHDHLVARVHEREHGGEDRLRRAGGDRDLGRRVVAVAVERLDLGGDALAQHRHAGHRRVLVEAGAHRRVDGVDAARGSQSKSGKPWPRLTAPCSCGQRRHHREDRRADRRAGGSSTAGVRGGAGRERSRRALRAGSRAASPAIARSTSGRVRRSDSISAKA